MRFTKILARWIQRRLRAELLYYPLIISWVFTAPLFAFGWLTTYQFALLLFFMYGHLTASQYYIEWKAARADRRRRLQLHAEARRQAIKRMASRPLPPTIDG